MSEDHTPDIKGDTVSPIIEVLKKKDSPASVRITAIKALGAIGAQAQQAIPILEQTSNDENPAIRESALEALRKINVDDKERVGKITYEDIKRIFSEDDLSRYNLLCKEYVSLRNNVKNNIELWNMVQYPSKLRMVLDEIHILRDKYDLLKYEPFLTVWRFDPNSNKYEEMCW